MTENMCEGTLRARRELKTENLPKTERVRKKGTDGFICIGGICYPKQRQSQCLAHPVGGVLVHRGLETVDRCFLEEERSCGCCPWVGHRKGAAPTCSLYPQPSAVFTCIFNTENSTGGSKTQVMQKQNKKQKRTNKKQNKKSVRISHKISEWARHGRWEQKVNNKGRKRRPRGSEQVLLL